ncbi:TY2B-B, partial [Symbiodinium sp. KB8]
MNGVGGSGGDNDSGVVKGPALESAETVSAGDMPRGSGDVPSVTTDGLQRTQIRTDTGGQAASSGMVGEKHPSHGAGNETALNWMAELDVKNRGNVQGGVGEGSGNGSAEGSAVFDADAVVIENVYKIKNVNQVAKVMISRTQGDDAQRAGGGTETATAAILEALTKNLVSMQEMQMKAMKRDLEDGDTPEQVKSSVVSLPALVGPEDASAAILFQDWLAQVNVPMQDLSASSGSWWKDVMKLVQDTYGKWLASTPIERLQLEPIGHERLTSLKWTRVNSRACSLILQCLTEGVKADLIARRAVQSTPMSWPRWMQRCKDLNMTTPDGSVLAKALTVVTARFIGENADTQFRTQLMRSSLRIDAQPTVTDVMKYHQHLQAEIESLMSARALSASPGPAVKNVSAVNSPSAPSTGQGSQKQPCKYFVKASGCRRGQKCPYLHDWATMNKAERARRCLVCGGEDHRQKDCPTKAPRQTPKGGAVSQNPTAATSSSPTERTPKVQSLEPDSEASPTAQVPVVASEPVWTLESLIQAAAKVAGASGQAPKAPSINVLAIRHKSGAEPGLTSYALVDSGATHALRRASDQNEWDEADPVIVNLAGGESVGLRMNKAGTILVQPTSLTSATST